MFAFIVILFLLTPVVAGIGRGLATFRKPPRKIELDLTISHTIDEGPFR